MRKVSWLHTGFKVALLWHTTTIYCFGQWKQLGRNDFRTVWAWVVSSFTRIMEMGCFFFTGGWWIPKLAAINLNYRELNSSGAKKKKKQSKKHSSIPKNWMTFVCCLFHFTESIFGVSTPRFALTSGFLFYCSEFFMNRKEGSWSCLI